MKYTPSNPLEECDPGVAWPADIARGSCSARRVKGVGCGTPHVTSGEEHERSEVPRDSALVGRPFEGHARKGALVCIPVALLCLENASNLE